jgi:hypothetical protein
MSEPCVRPIAKAGCDPWQRAEESMKPLSSEANGARGSTGVASTGGGFVGAACTSTGGRPASDTGTESSPAHLTISPANASAVNTTAATAPMTVHLLAENR